MKPSNNSGSNYVTKIRGLKEKPQDIAVRALRLMTKSSRTAIQLDEVPGDLLFGETVDLHRWSIILKDAALEELSGQRSSGKKFYLDGSSPTLSGMFHDFWIPRTCPRGLLTLNIAQSQSVTDYGITIIANMSPCLNTLVISGCPQITDVGLREVALKCPKLQTLDISSCVNIDGVGLVAVAECCPFVSKLNLSRNAHIKNWSLQNIFRKLFHLEEINISYMKDITDEEVRVIGEQCKDLSRIEAQDCFYLSDQGILYLSQSCKDLDYIDFSRSDMAYRISDIALMAIGQRLVSLRVLKMNHCDHISDVGLTWLSEGCKILEVLEIYGCSKVTDAGLRVLGANCHALKCLDFSHAKTISDVGLASLTKGCKSLQSVKFHGMFYLSDPRFIMNVAPAALDTASLSSMSAPNTPTTRSAPINKASSSSTNMKHSSSQKLNSQAEIWEEVIGVQALTINCPSITTLDVSGCFRLNKILGQSLPSLKQLSVLNMKGCNQVSSMSLMKIGQGCALLSELNLSDCGKGVNNEVLLVFQQYCPNMKVLQCCRCLEIRGLGVKAISNMLQLEKLDLAGCVHLTDSMLVHLTHGDRVPKLHYLDLSSVPKLTDSVLAWIAMKDQRLLLLNVKGTSISMKAIASVRDRFPNSEILQVSDQYGFFPKARVKDRILLNDYARMIQGMVKIQSRYRKYKAHCRVANIQHEKRVLAAHLLLHKMARGFLVRKEYLRQKRYHEKINRASAMITTCFRMLMAKKRVAAIRFAQYEAFRAKLLTKLQSKYRQYRAKKLLASMKKAKYELHLCKVACTIVIQSLARMYLAKCKCYRIKNFHYKRQDYLRRKILMIQRNYRGYKKRQETTRLKQLLLNAQRRRVSGARKIQKKVRIYLWKLFLWRRYVARMIRLTSCIAIQASVRGYLERLHYAESQYEIVLQRKQKAIIKIQCIFRVYFAKKRFKQRMKLRLATRNRENFYANVIIRQVRIRLARMIRKRKHAEYIERLRKDATRKFAALVKIQALFRRVLSRKLYLAKINERKNQWKELYDNQKHKRFFYNKATGEIRWKIPQDLLDLIPHPNCDNCNATEAALECRHCSELYCGSCFTLIHANGRRKEHEYRALYDFYGKRIDYGDGEGEDEDEHDHSADGDDEREGAAVNRQNKITSKELYPCQWPTEMIQDEIQGWMLNVAPYRQPYAVYKQSGWEEYHADPGDYRTTLTNNKGKKKEKKTFEQERIEASMGKQAPKVFYFNRNSFETTYDMPQEVWEELNPRLNSTTSIEEVSRYGIENGGMGYYNTPQNFFTPPAGQTGNTALGGGYEDHYGRLEYSNSGAIEQQAQQTGQMQVYATQPQQNTQHDNAGAGYYYYNGYYYTDSTLQHILGYYDDQGQWIWLYDHSAPQPQQQQQHSQPVIHSSRQGTARSHTYHTQPVAYSTSRGNPLGELSADDSFTKESSKDPSSKKDIASIISASNKIYQSTASEISSDSESEEEEHDGRHRQRREEDGHQQSTRTRFMGTNRGTSFQHQDYA